MLANLSAPISTNGEGHGFRVRIKRTIGPGNRAVTDGVMIALVCHAVHGGEVHYVLHGARARKEGGPVEEICPAELPRDGPVTHEMTRSAPRSTNARGCFSAAKRSAVGPGMVSARTVNLVNKSGQVFAPATPGEYASPGMIGPR